MNYDFTDPLIRQMVDKEHVPTEFGFHFAPGAPVEVNCLRCGQVWPCEARQALRQYEKDQREKAFEDYKNLLASHRSLRRLPWQ